MNRTLSLSIVSAMVGLVLCCCGSASAATYLVDFNTTDGGSYPGGSSAWNIYATPADINGSAIHDTSSPTPTSVTLNKSGTIADSSNGGAAVFNNATGGPSWVTTDGSLTNTGAAGDYFFTSTSVNHESFTITFGGLSPNQIAYVDMWHSRVTATSEGLYEYSLDGGATWSGFTVLEKDGSASTGDGWVGNTTKTKGFQGIRDGNNNARYMHVGGLTLTGSTLLVRTTDTEVAGSWSAIGAIRLTVIPEPSAAALMAIQALTLLRRRRA